MGADSHHPPPCAAVASQEWWGGGREVCTPPPSALCCCHSTSSCTPPHLSFLTGVLDTALGGATSQQEQHPSRTLRTDRWTKPLYIYSPSRELYGSASHTLSHYHCFLLRGLLQILYLFKPKARFLLQNQHGGNSPLS